LGVEAGKGEIRGRSAKALRIWTGTLPVIGRKIACLLYAGYYCCDNDQTRIKRFTRKYPKLLSGAQGRNTRARLNAFEIRENV
jgi:hypothetical protein